jgi:hypothetical protein
MPRVKLVTEQATTTFVATANIGIYRQKYEQFTG